jgi:DNA polymerase elongation subunit (family B)
MIIATYETDEQECPSIYLRYRDEDGNVMENYVSDYRPYFYVAADSDMSRITEMFDERFRGWYAGEKTSISLPTEELPEGRELLSIVAPSPSSVKGMRDLCDETWEADIHFPDRFAIDNINPKDMPDWFPNMVRAGGFDLEWNEEGELTAMGFTTDGEVVRQWSWHPTHEGLGAFRSEREMLLSFADAFKTLDPDLITTWSGNRADWPKMYERYKHHYIGFDWMSPLSDVSSSPPMTHLPRSGVYEDGSQVIPGRMTVDLADRNHGFERVWRDSGNGQLSDRRLGAVGKVAFPDSPELWKIDTNGITHHDLWLNHFDDFLKYHRADVILTDRLDREYHVTRFFMALQRVCGVSFGSVFTVSRFARGLLRRRASWASPTGLYNKGKGDSYGGGFVAEPKTGRHNNVAVFDYRAMYAEIQRADNISPEMLRHEAGENIRAVGNGTFWSQESIGVLPQLQMDLADARNAAKAEMKKHEAGTSEHAGFNTLQLAFKRAAASVYGLMGHTGHGEAHRTVAATITYVGRSLVSRLMDVCEEMGYEPLAGHTDSAYIGIGDDDGEEIADALTRKIQKEFDSERFVVEYEKLMSSWVAAKKNRNFGWVTWPREALHCTGFEMKKSNAAWLTKHIQETAFESLCRENATEEDIRDMMNNWIRAVRTLVKRESLVMRSRLGKKAESYGQQGGFQGAAKDYNRRNPDNRFEKGDGVPHVYTTRGIEAFRTDEELEALDIDYTTVIQKQIIAPVSLIFEAMGWRELTADGATPQEWW